MKIGCGILLILLLVLQAAFTRPSDSKVGIAPTIQFIKAESEKFAASTLQLHAAIKFIKDDDSNSIVNARQALMECRLNYKKIEFLLRY